MRLGAFTMNAMLVTGILAAPIAQVAQLDNELELLVDDHTLVPRGKQQVLEEVSGVDGILKDVELLEQKPAATMADDTSATLQSHDLGKTKSDGREAGELAPWWYPGGRSWDSLTDKEKQAATSAMKRQKYLSIMSFGTLGLVGTATVTNVSQNIFCNRHECKKKHKKAKKDDKEKHKAATPRITHPHSPLPSS